MKPSAQRVFAALLRGEKISIHDSKRLSCGAIGQRLGEIAHSPELAHLGLTISSDWGRVRGEKQAWKVWWIEGMPKQSQPKTVAIVREHTRRLNVIEDEQPDQISLFG